jgi:hypothetical protein
VNSQSIVGLLLASRVRNRRPVRGWQAKCSAPRSLPASDGMSALMATNSLGRVAILLNAKIPHSGLANMSPREEWQAEDYRALADCRGEGDSPTALST